MRLSPCLKRVAGYPAIFSVLPKFFTQPYRFVSIVRHHAQSRQRLGVDFTKHLVQSIGKASQLSRLLFVLPSEFLLARSAQKHYRRIVRRLLLQFVNIAVELFILLRAPQSLARIQGINKPRQVRGICKRYSRAQGSRHHKHHILMHGTNHFLP